MTASSVSAVPVAWNCASAVRSASSQKAVIVVRSLAVLTGP